jgi:hypothetical protein
MFVQRVSSFAKFTPERMGKTTIVQGGFLFAGLNCFEPGQEHAPMRMRARTSSISFWKAAAWFKSAVRLSVYPPATRPLHRPASSIQFAIQGRSGWL